MYSNNNSVKLTAITIDKDGAARPALKWAIENVVGRGQPVVLLHFKQTNHASCNLSSHSPSNMPRLSRNSSPIHENQGNGDVDPNTKDIFLPYRVYCTRKDIHCHDIVLEDTDEVRAILDFVNRIGVETLVLSSTSKSNNFFRFKVKDITTSITKQVPEFCTVHVINRGKLTTTKGGSQPLPTNFLMSPLREQLVKFHKTINHHNRPSPESPNVSLGSLTSSNYGQPRLTNDDTHSSRSPLFPQKRVPNGFVYEISTDSDISFVSSGRPSVDSLFPRESFDSGSTSLGRLSGLSDLDNNIDLGSLRHVSLGSGGSFTPDQSFASVEQSSEELEDEMRRLKLRLKQTIDMQDAVGLEALSEKQKALQKWKQEQEKLEALRIAEEEEQEEQEAAVATNSHCNFGTLSVGHGTAEVVKRVAERESKRRISAEMKAIKESTTSSSREKNNNYLGQSQSQSQSHKLSDIRYRKYTIEEIEQATNYFNNALKIGEGGYGPVYKCTLDHTPVAVKVLRPDAAQGRSQFHQEVEVLSCIRHPHMVLLLGACPEYGCLVYEYMCNGSLEDRLFRRGNTPSLSWQHRFTISHEIGLGLLFLHQTKPEPLVHRDLKPGNILLDRNYVSKISDVGLARLVPPSVADTVTQYRMTSTAGTFCYIDPEYQQTGMLGVKSDIYSLGIIFLQLLTGKPPMGLTHYVERAIHNGKFHDILDKTVPNWPLEEALSLAKLALRCAQLRRKDRPDLGKVVMPELDNLRELAEKNMSYPIMAMSGPIQPLFQSCVSQNDSSYPVASHSNGTESVKSE